MRAAAGEHLAAAGRFHAGAEAVTALADDFAGLIGALHGPVLEGPGAIQKGAELLERGAGPVNGSGICGPHPPKGRVEIVFEREREENFGAGKC